MNHINEEKSKYILITCIIISTISVLACVAVVLFVFVLDIDFNCSKAKNSHNEDMEYAADFHYNSAKLADELAQQIQTALKRGVSKAKNDHELSSIFAENSWSINGNLSYITFPLSYK